MFEDFTMPIIHILSAGEGGLSEAEALAFNYFFSLMVGMGFLLFIPVAIFKLFQRS